MSLSLSCARATITKIVPDRRADDDGAKHTTVALKIEVKTDAGILAEFHPELRHAMFKGHGGVRFAAMKEIGWEGTRRGCDLAIRPGPDMKAHITLSEVTLRDFKLKPITDGAQDMVALRFVAFVENPTAPVGRILEYLKEESWIDVKAAGELDLPPPSAGTRIDGLDKPADFITTTETLRSDAGHPPVTPEEVLSLSPAEVKKHVGTVRKLQASRKDVKERLERYPNEVLFAAIQAEQEAANCRPMFVKMLEGELKRRSQENPQ